MKKFFTMFAIAAMSVALVACGGEEKKDEKRAEGAKTEASAQKSELEKQAEHFGKLRAFYMVYDDEAAYDKAFAESQAWIKKNGSKAEDLMGKYYDQTWEKANELFDNDVPMNEAKKQLGIE